MPTKSAPRRSSPYAITPKAGGRSAKASASKRAAKKVARPGVKERRAKKAKPVQPVIGGVRKGHERGKVSPDVLKATHQEWKERMKQDRIAHMGVGKKATHSKVPVARRLEFER